MFAAVTERNIFWRVHTHTQFTSFASIVYLCVCVRIFNSMTDYLPFLVQVDKWRDDEKWKIPSEQQ